jgi:meiotically up-regulated gene 157 (Mug157) protein
MRSGIESHGVVKVPSGERVYAYEVDGRGAALTDFDDPNIPSLISVPMLGFPYDREVYAATRKRLLDPATNRWGAAGAERCPLGWPACGAQGAPPLCLAPSATSSQPAPLDTAAAPCYCRYYFNGSEFRGMGSPHTSSRFAWALGIYTEVRPTFFVLFCFLFGGGAGGGARCPHPAPSNPRCAGADGHHPGGEGSGPQDAAQAAVW